MRRRSIWTIALSVLLLGVTLLSVAPAGAASVESERKQALRRCRAFYPKPRFVDVKPHQAHYCAISWAANRGYVAGFKSGAYGPALPVTRKQVITMRDRVKGSYGERQRTIIGPWLRHDATREYVAEKLAGSTALAVRRGLFRGDALGHFKWKSKVTRAQMATVLARWVRSEYMRWGDIPVPGAYF